MQNGIVTRNNTIIITKFSNFNSNDRKRLQTYDN